MVIATSCSGPQTSAGTNAPTTQPAPSTPAVPGAPRCSSDGVAVRDLSYRTVAGVDPAQLTLDVYPVATSGKCAPVVMWVHGGGFRRGDKTGAIDDKVRLFNAEGWIVVSINYRLTTPTSPQPSYPGPFDDAATAVRWVRDNIAGYGGDPDRLAVLGHSAGASIVASLATDDRLLSAASVALSDVSCAGPLDTEQFDLMAMQRLADGEDGSLTPVYGSDPAVLADISPINNIAAGKGIPPMIVASRGSAGRQSIVADFVTTLEAAGVEVVVIDAQNLDHEAVNRSIGAANDQTMTPHLLEFLRGCLETPTP